MKTAPCFVCKKPSVIHLAYAAQHLCSGCFIKHIEKRFMQSVREFRMINAREHIAIGLSGGKDSVVLLHLLSMLRKKLPFKISAIAIDEGIKGYRNLTLITAKKECKKLKIPLKILSFKKDLNYSLDAIMKKTNKAACSWCGVFRRYLLNLGARQVNADKIAIGHNLDDISQTVLMNIMRNEPLRLVRFLDPLTLNEHLIPRIRPLIRIPEKEIALYAMLKGLEIKFMECPYAHFSFRQHIKEQLNDTEEKYPGTKLRILKSFIEMEKLMRKSLKDKEFVFIPCKKCGEPSSTISCMKCKMLEELSK
ncbi:TIGR00269 family protein [Candidatus Micrarchaeota archaeon]|nr:TIGR00269 family protein [Candidatus Micrarchaeota archaeon]